ncbi:hypothetical protein AWU65_14630 [Paenibacillus glucanolyticus]|uniref:Uncharacterized protein n=1 Tax=Paenibacillus glucanolyticus TaxID=59843 RepID=A0A163K9H1_9BACL|nr:hypothetical protein AWU65_14630 [Paenibacillus glucanolyticus]
MGIKYLSNIFLLVLQGCGIFINFNMIFLKLSFGICYNYQLLSNEIGIFLNIEYILCFSGSYSIKIH